MITDIRRVAKTLAKKYDTHDPFEIAKQMKIEYIIGPLGNRCGCYMYLKRHRCIFLNENLSDHEMKLVMAHELGHAILHRTENCYFIRNKTLLSTDKIELDANKFAIELLLDTDTLNEYLRSGYSKEQISRITGYSMNLIDLKLRD